MPLYDYHCKLCGKTFEVRQKFADELLQKHEGCGGDVERLISAPALQFKGSGFYITDYGRSGQKGADNGKSDKSGDKKSDSSKTESKSESKSESKPESKAEKKSESKSESKPAPSKPASE